MSPYLPMRAKYAWEMFSTKLKTGKRQKITVDPKSDADTLRNYFATILPNFDRDRVYPTDIKKVIVWYNLLIDNNLTDFLKKEEEKTSETEA